MKCPNCGFEIREGHLYCEGCGMEIRIVPDFEPEIENSITETLSGVAEEIDGSRKDQAAKESEGAGKDREEAFLEEPGKNRTVTGLLALLAVILAAAAATAFLYFRYSVSHQVERARACADQGDYGKAVEFLDKAVSLEPDAGELVLLQSNYYYAMGDLEKAAEVLLTLIETQKLPFEQLETAYKYIIAIYDEQGSYEEINELLKACPEPSIVTGFQNYMAMPPEFSYEGGSYDEVVPLKLSANTTGTIYYTLDGSEPDEGSRVYTSPIFLESGTYRVSALFINDYGIVSEVVKNRYEINLTVPDPPEVQLYSGEYETPVYITVSAPEGEKIYYTTDGSEPSADSLQYTEPILVPLGRSNYKFAVISGEGVSSDIISRSYHLKLNTEVTTDAAVRAVMWALIDRDVLTDMQGHAPGKKGRYVFQYDTIVKIGENYYYKIVEAYEDTGGSQSRTGHLYAVEIYTGQPNRLIYDEQGEMGLISLESPKLENEN